MSTEITAESLLAFRKHLKELRRKQGSFSAIEKKAKKSKGYMTKYIKGDLKITQEVKDTLLPILDEFGYSEWLAKRQE